MKSGLRTAIVAVALLARAVVSLAQHEGHQMGGAPTGQDACLPHAKEGLRVVETANRQLEEARQTNSPQRMRAAISELQAALGEVRTHLSLCVARGPAGSGTPGMEGMDHSGIKVMDMAAPPGQPARPTATEGMDHSKMGQEKTPAPKSQKPPSAPMDHSKMGQGKPATSTAAPAKDFVDPVCGKDAGAQATEKATYQGKTYFFCSRADRERFLSDPEKYVNR